MSITNIASFNIAEWHESEPPVYAFLLANKNFTSSEGIRVAKGTRRQAGLRQQFDASVVDGFLQIHTGPAFATTNSTIPGATYTLVVTNAGGKEIYVVAKGLRVPHDPPSTTWGNIIEYSRASYTPAPANSLSADQIYALINALVDPIVPATDAIGGLGAVEVDTAPTFPTRPRVVGINSPLVALGGSGAAGRLFLDRAPADGAHPEATGTNSPRVMKTLETDYAGLIANLAAETQSVQVAIKSVATGTVDHTIPDNVAVDIQNSGMIVGDNCTIVVKNLVNRSPGKKFGWIGTGKVLVENVSEHDLSWWAGNTPASDNKPAIDQVRASIAARGGGVMYLPGKDWPTSGNVLSEGFIIRGDGRERSRLMPVADGQTVLTHGDSVRYLAIRDIGIVANGKQNCTAYSYDRISPNLGGFIRVENCEVSGFVGINGKGFNLAPLDAGGQLQNFSIDRASAVFNNTTNYYINTGNTEISVECVTAVGDGQTGAYIERCGNVSFHNEFAGTASYGHNQLLAGTIAVDPAGVTAGILPIVVRAAGMPHSPKTVNINIAAMPTGGGVTRAQVAAAVAQEVRDGLGTDPDVACFFHVAGFGPNYQLKTLDPAANDGTMAQTITPALGITAGSISRTDVVTNTASHNVTSAAGGFFDDFYLGWTAVLTGGSIVGTFTSQIINVPDANTLTLANLPPASSTGVSMSIAPVIAGAPAGPGGGVPQARGLYIANNAHGSINFYRVQEEGFGTWLDNRANDLTSEINFYGCAIQDACRMNGSAPVKFYAGRTQDKVVRGSLAAISSCSNFDVCVDTYINDPGGPSLFVNQNTKRLTNFTGSMLGIRNFEVSLDQLHVLSDLPMILQHTSTFASKTDKPWLTIINSSGNPNQPQLRIGHGVDDNGNMDYWYDIFRSLDPNHLGRLYIKKNQANVGGLDVDGDIRGQGVSSNFIFGKIGYSPGAGQIIPQFTSKATAITIHGVSYQIRMFNDVSGFPTQSVIAAGGVVEFTVNNNIIAATDTISVTVAKDGAVTDGAYAVRAHSVGLHTCKIEVKNLTGGALSEPVLLNFGLIGGANV